MAHEIRNAEAVLRFALAGNATLTLRSRVTGERRTYRIRACDDKPGLFFVGALRGSDNTSDYSYIGIIRDGEFRHGEAKAKMGADSVAVRAFAWSWRYLSDGKVPEQLEVWHEDRCGRCGRALTVPESIETGLGPECAEALGVPYRRAS